MDMIETLREHVVEKVPTYSYLGESGKKSYFRYWKFRLANWIMEDKLMGTVRWYNKLLEIMEKE